MASTAITVAAKVPFSELCGLLEKVSKAHGADNKKKILKSFVEKWREAHTSLHAGQSAAEAGDSFYPAMRLLLPQLEKERVAYGMKEHALAKMMIDAHLIGKDSRDGQKLLNYKAPKTARGSAGDFAEVAYFVLQSRCPATSSLSVQQVNEQLDLIAKHNAAKEKERVRQAIMMLTRNLTAMQCKWLIRMIMKELHAGFQQASMFSSFHPDAEEYFNVNSDIKKVCINLHDPNKKLNEIEIGVGSAFRPMLGDRGDLNRVENLMDNKPFYIEIKYDGERVQLHKDGDDYKYFSRSGNEYSSVYGANVFEGNLTPYIHNCFKENVDKVILDGEMMGYNHEQKIFRTKGENMDVKVLNSDGFTPCFIAFDILLLNNDVLSNKPLSERVTHLSKVFVEQEGRIMLTKRWEARTKQDCADALNDAIDRREEGIMVKKPDSVYKPNVRRGGWYKIKPEYITGLWDELDVIIIGGYLGKGSRARVMSHFLCALAVDSGDDKPTEFVSVCRVGSGYTHKQLYELNSRLTEHWNVFNKKKPPPGIKLTKEKPEFVIDPENSVILQLKAAELVPSDKFAAGYTLRFPRVERVRDDKPWHQCMTTTELQQLQSRAEGKLASRHAMIDEDEESPKKKRKVASHHVRPTIASQFKGADSSDVKKVGDIFTGREFCVVNGPASLPKVEMEKKILEHSGLVVQNPGPETTCIVVAKSNMRSRNLISRGNYDVVKAEWLLRCLEEKRFIQWVPGDMIHSTKATESSFSERFDRYGDSYTEPCTEAALRDVFEKIDSSAISTQEIAEVEMEHYPDECEFGLFRMCEVFVDQPESPSQRLSALELRMYGAHVSSDLHDDVSHVIVTDDDLLRQHELRKLRRQRDRKFHIVTSDWIRKCIDEGRLVQERTFEPTVV